jgi:hypothetical protein
VGINYDVETGTMSLARLQLDLILTPQWRIEAITSWNGSLGRYDYESFRITRDLHCCEVSLSYDNEYGYGSNKGFSLDFHIKAFPGIDRFGIGQGGQHYDTSMGQYTN